MSVYLIKSCSLRLLHDEINKIIGQSKNVVRMNLDEVGIDNVTQECLYDSLLGENKYVVVNNFKINKENNVIEKYLAKPNPNTTLILNSENMDKRSVIYKTINQKGHVIIIDEIKDIQNKINKYAKDKNINIDYLAITKLLEHNLDNYDLALNEIDKISLVTNEITSEIIEKYTKKLISEDNFEFCDAIIKQDYKKINECLNNFINLKCELSPFISLLAGQYRIIYAVKNMDGSNDAIAEKIKVHPYRVKLARENALRYSKDEIQKILLDLCDLDYNIKTSKVDKYILFKIFIVNI